MMKICFVLKHTAQSSLLLQGALLNKIRREAQNNHRVTNIINKKMNLNLIKTKTLTLQ